MKKVELNASRRCISLSDEHYEALKAESLRTHVPFSTLVERMLDEVVDPAIEQWISRLGKENS